MDEREKLVERIAELEGALGIAESWLERWAEHVGGCRGSAVCTCGLTRVRYDLANALRTHDE